MIVGIVGADARKFNEQSQVWARRRILEVFTKDKPDRVVSGRCPKGGIDIWAIQEATRVGLPTHEFAPGGFGWYWFKARNIQIAEAADKVVCIVSRYNAHGITLRKTHRNKPFCMHCFKAGTPHDHVQSGGCWTMHYARKIGKAWQLIVVGAV